MPFLPFFLASCTNDRRGQTTKKQNILKESSADERISPFFSFPLSVSSTEYTPPDGRRVRDRAAWQTRARGVLCTTAPFYACDCINSSLSSLSSPSSPSSMVCPCSESRLGQRRQRRAACCRRTARTPGIHPAPAPAPGMAAALPWAAGRPRGG